MSCGKWDGPKVSWKFNDPPGYDTHCELKSSMSVFKRIYFKIKTLQHVFILQPKNTATPINIIYHPSYIPHHSRDDLSQNTRILKNEFLHLKLKFTNEP